MGRVSERSGVRLFPTLQAALHQHAPARLWVRELSTRLGPGHRDMTHAVPTVSGRDNCVRMMAQQEDPGDVGAQGKEGAAHTEGQLGSSADLGWR